MSITRHDQSSILSQAVVYGDTVYLAATNLNAALAGHVERLGYPARVAPDVRAELRTADLVVFLWCLAAFYSGMRARRSSCRACCCGRTGCGAWDG